MKFLSSVLLSLSLAAIVSGANHPAPFCTGRYANTKANCQKFHFNGKPDCDPNGPGPKFLNLKHPSKFSTERVREYAVSVTNVFENHQASNDYATCVNIGDGRGFTCGSGGYTSDDGSMQDPLQRYAKLCKQHHQAFPFAKYMAEINKIANDQGACGGFTGKITGLNGLDKVWTKAACTDPLFRKAQDSAAFSEIDFWAQAHAGYQHIRTNLGLLVFRDTMEMHGDGGGEPHIGLERIMELTTSSVGTHASEHTYISKFLDVRRQMLCCYRPDGDMTWPFAADRISDMQGLVAAGNWDLTPPINLPAYKTVIKADVNLTATPTECNQFHH